MMEVATQSFLGKPSEKKVREKLDKISKILQDWSIESPF